MRKSDSGVCEHEHGVDGVRDWEEMRGVSE